MEIVTTFVPNLYAFRLSEEGLDELERVLDEWEDPLFLFEFFTDNEADLKGEFTIEEAVEKTRTEVKKFRKRMLELASSKPHKLNHFFTNLDNLEYRQVLLPRQKAKQKWLRLYALKIEDEENTFYVITGGMIKLTLNMEDRDHGKHERTKLNRCKDFLKDNGVYDADSFFEIFF
jgi:DNA-binding PadR family transcriptional regulator